jgi:predicted RNase H-like HicB family nuclease
MRCNVRCATDWPISGPNCSYLDSDQTDWAAYRRILIARRAKALITFKVETEQEDDGRWLAEVLELPGVLAYGDTQEAALSRVQALALRVVAERLEHGEAGPELLSISFNAA